MKVVFGRVVGGCAGIWKGMKGGSVAAVVVFGTLGAVGTKCCVVTVGFGGVNGGL